ncbi:serine/threonine protein kinase [Nitzschia inconspicua]|uniref:Serine/threonine protein kinase n=1 Tax=Nitzschia inconspicua TaxID=303405 RepID=A0A9K3Q3E1_9STRA|nr:serine/threonine protein kinase [Nitzschia inconspicua]
MGHLPVPQDPLPEHIEPIIHEAVSNPQIWVVPQGSARATPVFRQVFLCRRNQSTQAYQIIQPPAFQPVELSHGGPIWGYLFMGVLIPRRHDLIYEEPIDDAYAQRVAIKRLDLRVVALELQNGSKEDPFKEIYRMQTIGDNHHVLGIIEALQDDRYLYIITPWCEGGSLLTHIPLQPGDLTLDQQARILFEQILENLHYLNRVKGICHRDIKPGNFLVSGEGRVLLSDLAMSFQMPPGGLVNHIGQFGTPPYMLPEIAMRSPFDGSKCDLWASIVSLYNLVTGLPFLYRIPHPDDILFRYCIMAKGLSRDMHNELVQEIIAEANPEDLMSLNTVAQRISSMSMNLLELFENALALDPDDRWTIEEVAACRWMQLER